MIINIVLASKQYTQRSLRAGPTAIQNNRYHGIFMFGAPNINLNTCWQRFTVHDLGSWLYFGFLYVPAPFSYCSLSHTFGRAVVKRGHFSWENFYIRLHRPVPFHGQASITSTLVQKDWRTMKEFKSNFLHTHNLGFSEFLFQGVYFASH